MKTETETEARVDPIAAARELHARFNVTRAKSVPVDLIAAECGAFVLWRNAGRADARVVRSGRVAYLGIDEDARGTPRARFSTAHELAHHQLHRGVDGVERIHGRPRREQIEFRVEREADKFAVELLLPEIIVLPLCMLRAPTMDDVAALALRFETSLTVAGRRWAALSPAPCAFVESRDGRIVRAKRSATFRGSAIGGRELDAEALATALGRGDAAEPRAARLHEDAWGSAKKKIAIHEESLVITGTRTVLTWLAHG